MTSAEVVCGVERRIEGVHSERSVPLCPTPNLHTPFDAGSPVRGVSLCTVRETTQSWVKVPKCGLSAIEGGRKP